MNTTSPIPEKLKFVAQINNVKEISLIGRAKISHWKERLDCESFIPFDNNGYAEVIISATDLKWKGVKFNEFIITVSVSDADNPRVRKGFYLVQAFNSFRFFAFFERALFLTPYDYGKVNVSSKFRKTTP